LLDCALSMLNYLGAWSLDRAWTPARHRNGAHQSLLPSQSFQTRDGWLVIRVMKEKFWERLVERMALPALGDDPRFRTFADRLANRVELSALLEAAFRRGTTAEWLERLRGHVPVAPVYSVAEALDDAQTLARGWWWSRPRCSGAAPDRLRSRSTTRCRYRPGAALARTGDPRRAGIGASRLAALRKQRVVATRRGSPGEDRALPGLPRGSVRLKRTLCGNLSPFFVIEGGEVPRAYCHLGRLDRGDPT
jgi:crotonobetainyl-CoA:carnitine CoA-transferase CaiB-like acyl-CoA transferase